MSSASAQLPIGAREPRRRDAEPVEELDRVDREEGAYLSVGALAPAGGRHGVREHDEATRAADALDEVDVLHDREWPVAADAVERRPGDEDRLVSVDASVEPLAEARCEPGE